MSRRHRQGDDEVSFIGRFSLRMRVMRAEIGLACGKGATRKNAPPVIPAFSRCVTGPKGLVAPAAVQPYADMHGGPSWGFWGTTSNDS